MKRILIPIFICSIIVAQEDEISDAPVDTTLMEVSIDTSELEPVLDIDFSLEFGYKGYQWGSKIFDLPQLQNMSVAQPGSDNKSVSMSGMLGLDSVEVIFVYSDSGFWKSEIDFQLDDDNIDKQIKSFLRIEKNVSEVYGNPFSTEQTVNGPSSSYHNFLNVKYSRAFYRSSWNVSPVRIALVLSGIVQQPKTENSLLEGDISFLRLVYYNPDYMITVREENQTEELPSIFELY
ncbi:MAG: hypothetical protein IIB45_03085 [Candidatus Marinimicrobia bacterium]|nr:hypothetical protein [Candidatus Neomarinimicrobiota bacterium]